MKYTILSCLAHLTLLLLAFTLLSPMSKSSLALKDQARLVQIHLIDRQIVSPQPNRALISARAPLVRAKQGARGLKEAAIVPADHGSHEILAAKTSQGPVLTLRDQPELIHDPTLRVAYPNKARLYRIEGTVRLRLTVDQQGLVSKAELVSGPAYGLREAALKLSSQLRFLPATDEYGQAKSADIEHEVVFRLQL